MSEENRNGATSYSLLKQSPSFEGYPSEGNESFRKGRQQTIDVDKKDRMEKILQQQGSRQLLKSGSLESLPPESAAEAMKHLLGFVHIDPDGGLQNMAVEQDLASDEFTKLHVMFKKEALRQVLGFVMIGRIMVNVPHVFVVATRTLICEYGGLCDTFSRPDLLSSCTLPLREFAIAVAFFEIVWMSAFVSTVIYDICAFLCISHRPSDGRAQRRYYHLANLFFFSFGYLQNFSALACLRYVHPGYIGHYVKMLNDTEEAAVHFGRRIFKVNETQVTDEDVHDMFLQVAYRQGWAKRASEAKAKVMESHSYKTTYDLFKDVMNLTDFDHDLIRDREGLGQSWKVRAVAFFETSIFVLFTVFVAVFGSMAFIVKLCRVAFVLLDVKTPWYWTFWTVLAFINQAMGIMAIQQMLRDRIIWFLFGGQDARVSLEERHLMLAYEALLAEKVWTVRSEGITNIKRCLALLTFNADDIQRLVLEEHTGEKEDVIRAVRAELVDEELKTDCFRQRVSNCIRDAIRGEEVQDI